MLQNRNPDMCDLTRGRKARLYGDLTVLDSMMNSFPLAYSCDIQEDKEPFFDSIDTTKLVLSVSDPMMASIKVSKQQTLDAASGPSLMATDLYARLIKKGVPFRGAYHLLGSFSLTVVRTKYHLAKFH